MDDVHLLYTAVYKGMNAWDPYLSSVKIRPLWESWPSVADLSLRLWWCLFPLMLICTFSHRLALWLCFTHAYHLYPWADCLTGNFPPICTHTHTLILPTVINISKAESSVNNGVWVCVCLCVLYLHFWGMLERGVIFASYPSQFAFLVSPCAALLLCSVSNLTLLSDCLN